MIGCLPTQAFAFLAVFVYAMHATHATQAIAFEWKPGFRPTIPIRCLHIAVLLMPIVKLQPFSFAVIMKIDLQARSQTTPIEVGQNVTDG